MLNGKLFRQQTGRVCSQDDGLTLPAVAAVSHRRHSWGMPTRRPTKQLRPLGSTDRGSSLAFGCSKGQSRTGQPGLAASPFIAEGLGRSTEAVG